MAVGGTCEDQGGFHCKFEDMVIYQFLTLESSEPAKQIEESESVLTYLNRQTMITGFKSGGTSPRFKIVRRMDDK